MTGATRKISGEGIYPLITGRLLGPLAHIWQVLAIILPRLFYLDLVSSDEESTLCITARQFIFAQNRTCGYLQNASFTRFTAPSGREGEREEKPDRCAEGASEDVWG